MYKKNHLHPQLPKPTIGAAFNASSSLANSIYAHCPRVNAKAHCTDSKYPVITRAKLSSCHSSTMINSWPVKRLPSRREHPLKVFFSSITAILIGRGRLMGRLSLWPALEVKSLGKCQCTEPSAGHQEPATQSPYFLFRQTTFSTAPSNPIMPFFFPCLKTLASWLYPSWWNAPWSLAMEISLCRQLPPHLCSVYYIQTRVKAKIKAAAQLKGYALVLLTPKMQPEL